MKTPAPQPTKSLPEILRDAMLLLDDGCESVVIARGSHEPLDGYSSAYQIRLRRHVFNERLSEYRGEARSWLGGQWASWGVNHGWLGGAAFDISDVLATDWRITS